ncbi:MAG: GTPase Era [Candidatus Pacebacteria bacterium]|nr:GTPase Era [Candidatus Paceibacterota bacterium]
MTDATPPIPTEPSHCGFIALVGIPNAGKSTLLNAVVGSKISIVSPKVQTTRQRILGIVMEPPAQLIFVDTPGIFSTPKRRLERAMVSAAWSGANDADLVMLLIDAVAGFGHEEQLMLTRLVESGRRLVLTINKIDLVPRTTLLPLIDALTAAAEFETVFLVSALTGDGVSDMRQQLARLVPQSPYLYPEDELSDIPMRSLAAELTREQLFKALFDELPYELMVETLKWQEFDNGAVRIEQEITVTREGQRAIILGHQGAMIKRIGAAARVEIAKILDRPVHLFLHVRVRSDWTSSPEAFRTMGLEFDS